MVSSYVCSQVYNTLVVTPPTYKLLPFPLLWSCVYANCHGFGVPPKHHSLMVLCNFPSYVHSLLYLFLMNLNH
jgi:hypothetical protein